MENEGAKFHGINRNILYHGKRRDVIPRNKQERLISWKTKRRDSTEKTEVSYIMEIARKNSMIYAETSISWSSKKNNDLWDLVTEQGPVFYYHGATDIGSGSNSGGIPAFGLGIPWAPDSGSRITSIGLTEPSAMDPFSWENISTVTEFEARCFRFQFHSEVHHEQQE